ncbi:2-amino-4-hydroxy-6-hydroxymethyldihydropteridine diphosphokinase [bacterium]|nr:2-amino-4-hydroxy-6-hydroxymethyldihydropteridine diphosphokinase [bacterium]
MNDRTDTDGPVENVFLSLGSNMGDRMAHLQAAMHALAQTPGIEIVNVSSLYETEPWGLAGQRPFYNAVAWIRTPIAPLALLRICQTIEHQRERVRDVRWGPRTLDIDILRYGDRVMSSLELTIPHPRMEERDFVLVPLAEVMTGSTAERPGVRRISGNWYPAGGQADIDL